MKKRRKLVIVTIIMLIVVIIPFAEISIKSIECYKDGVNIALEGTKMIFGMEAVRETLTMYIVFYFPLFVIWIMLFIAAVIITVLNINDKNNVEEI